MGTINDVVSLAAEGDIAVLTVNYPPVNALSQQVRSGILDGVRQAIADPRVRAIVIACDGKTFIAGADITEFGKPPQPPSLGEVETVIEGAPKPVIAAIHGTALGGGLELALCCHYRIAVPSARVGLPEVNLGILPGAGGTQRLPRIVGPEIALDLIVSGRPIGAKEANTLGVVDALAGETTLREDAIAFAQKIVAEKRPLVKVRDREDKVAPFRGKPEIFADFRKKNARLFKGF